MDTDILDLIVTLSISLEYHPAVGRISYRFADRHYAEWRHAECRGAHLCNRKL